MPLLSKLRELRERRELTQLQMAVQLGISKQFYSQLELGQRRLSYNMAVAIAGVLGTTPDALFLPDEYTQRGLNSHDVAQEVASGGR